jgi:hypothetical protein
MLHKQNSPAAAPPLDALHGLPPLHDKGHTSSLAGSLFLFQPEEAPMGTLIFAVLVYAAVWILWDPWRAGR